VHPSISRPIPFYLEPPEGLPCALCAVFTETPVSGFLRNRADPDPSPSNAGRAGVGGAPSCAGTRASLGVESGQERGERSHPVLAQWGE
jgi:hypothetical protein